MSFYIQNRFYVSYVKQVTKDSKPSQKKWDQKIRSLVIKILGFCFLSPVERRSIRASLSDKPATIVSKSTVYKTFGQHKDIADVSSLKVDKKYPVGFKRYSTNPFYNSVLEGDFKRFKELLVKATRADREIGLKLAVRFNRMEFVKLLFAQGLSNQVKRNIVQFAIRKGQVESLKYFLKEGIDVNIRVNGYSLLALTFLYKQPELAQLLMHSGGKFHIDDKGSNLKFLPLLISLIDSDKKNVELFLECFPKRKYSQYKEELFLLFKKFNFKDPLLELIKDFKLNVPALDSKQDCLNLAAGEGHYEIIDLLLQHGAKASGPKRPALASAAAAGSLPLVKLLVENHADIDQFNDLTPLIAAQFYGHEEIVDYLVQKGANRAFSEQIHCQKMLAHRFSLVGQLNLKAKYKGSLEGYLFRIGAIEFAKSLEQFFTDSKNLSMSNFPAQVSREKILKAIKEIPDNIKNGKYTDEALFAKYQAGEMIILPAGYRGHCTYRLLYKGFHLEVNQGNLFPDQILAGYRIDYLQAPLTPKIINKMRETQRSSLERSKIIRKKLRKKLNFKTLSLGTLESQTGGHCIYVSLLSIYRMMLLVERLEKNRLQSHISFEECLKEADAASSQIYEMTVRYDQEIGIKEAMRIYQHAPREQQPILLFNAVLGKFRGNEATSCEFAQFVKRCHPITWRNKNTLIHFLRKQRNHTLVPFLARQKLI